MDVPGHALNADGQILSHKTGFDGFDTNSLQCLCKYSQLAVLIQLCPVQQSS